MPTHYYVLDEPNATEPTFLYFMYQCADGRLKYSTGVKVLPSEWNAKKKSKSDDYRNAVITTDRINSMMGNVNLARTVNGKIPTCKELREQLDLLLGKVKVAKTENSFFAMFDKVILDRKLGKELCAGKRFSSGTIKQYERTKNLLLEWQLQTGYYIDPQTFNIHSYKALYAYLTNEKNLAINSVGGQLKNVKAVLRAMYTRGWHTSQFFRDENFKVMGEDSNKIYLTIPELEKLAAAEMDGTVKIARDWLIIEAFTGLRVSDALRLQSINISETKIHISNEKTDEMVVIPTHRLVKNILESYAGKWPPYLAAQTINEKIKIAAEIAGINGKVLCTITKGGKRIDTYMERHQLVTNHTGRRSFITNLLRINANDSMVMKLAGLKKATTLQKYNKMSAHEVADMAGEMEFFK